MTNSASNVVARICGVALIVSDLERAIAFYCDGLGFALEGRTNGPSPASTEALLDLGGVSLRLIQYAQSGAPYPACAMANDPWFQHFAIRVADMDAAYARLLHHGGQTAISIDGPQQLPPSTGSVIAYKFRDPDGHPLELSFVPKEPVMHRESPFIAIDHSAIVVANLGASIDFYVRRLGFVEAERLLNEGPAQWRLDGLDGAMVDIVVLRALAGGPHLELLHYRAPPTAHDRRTLSPKDIAATRLLVATADRLGTAAGSIELLVDPDDHLIELVRSADPVKPGYQGARDGRRQDEK